MTDGPRQSRSVATLERILASAQAAFRSHGFRGAGIAAICKGAGISPGHLYHYFASKEAIVAAIVDRERSSIHSEIDRLLTSDAPIRAIVSAVTNNPVEDGFGMDPALSLEIYAEAARNPVIQQILQNYDQQVLSDTMGMLSVLQQRGSVALNADLPTAARLLIALVDGVMIRRAVLDPKTDLTQFAKPLEVMLTTLLQADPEKTE